MFLFTEKNLIDVYDAYLTHEEAGINPDNFVQIGTREGLYNFYEVIDEDLYNKTKIVDVVVQSVEERDSMIAEKRAIQETERAEYMAKQPEGRLDVLEDENATLFLMLMETVPEVSAVNDVYEMDEPSGASRMGRIGINLFGIAKRYYDKGIYSKANVRLFVIKNAISEEQYKEITGEDFVR